MTVSTQTVLQRWPGTGAQTRFFFSLPVYSGEYVELSVWDSTQNIQLEIIPSSSYTLVLYGEDTQGGYVDYAVGSPMTADKILQLRLTYPYTQELMIRNQKGFLPKTLERQLDMMELQIQQVREQISRSLSVPYGEAPELLPSAFGRQGKFVSFDSLGNPVAVDPPEGTQGPVGPDGPPGPTGATGPQGERGASFSPNATGPTAARATYNTQPAGFSFLDTTTGLMYFKNTATSGDWSAGVSFSGNGNMLSATYDPQSKAADAFSRANHTGTQATSTITGLDTTLTNYGGRITTAEGNITALGTGKQDASFLQSGTGTIARAVVNKLQEALCVRDFGAVGDNSTDNTAKFNAAFLEAAVSGRSLYIPGGIYLVDTASLPYHPTVNQFYKYHIFGDYGNTVIRQRTGALSQNILQINSGGVNNRVGDIYIEQIQFDAQGNKSGGAAVYAYGVARFIMDKLLFYGAGKHYNGIVVNGVGSSVINDVKMFNPLNDGIQAFSDANTDGAQLDIMGMTVIQQAGQDAISIGGGLGGVNIAGLFAESGRYNLHIHKIFYNEKNREVTLGWNYSGDNSQSHGVHIATQSLQSLMTSAGCVINSGFNGASVNVEYQGPPSSSGSPVDDGALIQLVGIRAQQGRNPALIYKDTGTLIVSACQMDYRYGSATSGILLQIPTSNLANLIITGNSIRKNTGYAISAAGQAPASAVIAGNCLRGNTAGALQNIPSSSSGVWQVGLNST